MADPREAVVRVDPVTEQVILAAEVVDDEARALLTRRYPPDFFLVEEHRAYQAAMVELVHRKLQYDEATLQRIAPGLDVAYLGKLAEMRPTAPPDLYGFHCQNFEWDRQRATAATGPVASFLEALGDPTAAPERVRALARSVGDAFEGGVGAGRYLADPDVLIDESMRDLEDRIEGRASFSCGIETLDCFEPEAGGHQRRRLMPGTSPGTVTTIIASTSSGKSTLAANMVLGIARERRRKVLYGAWEMKPSVTLQLLAILSLGWSRADVFDPQTAAREGRPFTEERKRELRDRQRAIAQWVTFLRNPFGEVGDQSTDRNLSVMREHVEESGADVFFADLFERCIVDVRPAEERKALIYAQRMTEELKIHTVLIHQLRKDVQARADARPTLEAIKGSGAWGEVTDQALGVYRPALFKKVPDTTIEVLVLKQRYGPAPLAVEFDWNAALGTVKNGRSVEYERPGDQGGVVDEFTAPKLGSKRQPDRHQKRDGWNR